RCASRCWRRGGSGGADGAGLAAAGTGEQLDALERGDSGYLGEAAVYAVDEPVERGRLGMCGLLDTYPAHA
ncbi:hypothetical protein JM949_33815, partial [Micromonospora sp. STR1s_6]|nr:hypothetical protein [Micromonospora tarensis]